MILIFLILFLLITPILVVGLHRWRHRPGLTWLLSAIFALISWLFLLFARFQMPETFTLGSGAASFIFPFVMSFVLDKISWPFALAILVILVAYFFVSARQLSELVNTPRGWSVWPAVLFFSGLGLCGLASGNLYTLLLSWAALDLAWLVLKLVGGSPRKGIHFSFGLRAFGLFVAITAVFSNPGGLIFTFPILNAQTNTLLFIAAMVRLLAIIPVSISLPQEYPWQNFNRYLDLVFFATGLIIFCRTANIGISEPIAPFLLALAAISGLICSFLWLCNFRSSNSWLIFLIGFSSFSIAGALLANFEASLAWSIALLITGSLVYFCNFDTRLLKLILSFGMIGIIGLPFTPAWQGIRIYPLPDQIFQQGGWWIAFLIGQALFLGGFLRAWITPKPAFMETERWSAVVYPAGLILLFVTQMIILIWGVPGLSNDLQAFPGLVLSWAPLLAFGIAVVTFLIRKRTTAFELRVQKFDEQVQNRGLSGVYRLGNISETIGGKMVSLIDQIFEGEAGILWTLLFLLLFFALLISVNIGVGE